ncbi:soti [Drosophila busckii]|uniref:Male-specific protein scotti n=1 Tax=Drosophila busckii TaxID=30019 RepID=A0A0M4F550_DROBS|nr:male-specific protein scotti [Drosophila busckii]ALC46595.1 soti [Drosophila busckii]
MAQRPVDQLLHLQLPDVNVELVNVINLPDGDGDGDAPNDNFERHLDEAQMQAIRAENPQVAMFLDAPHEPPIELHHMLEPVNGNVPQRPRKKRSFLTISKPFHAQPERCALIADGWRAIQCVRPEQRCEYFINYMDEHLNTRNYPNGDGLPTRWGQY